jgi:teichuronic acid biosynthesis glycosyltransferase TuaC
MKILFVTAMYPDAENPGYGAFVKQQAEAIRNQGHKVDVLHFKGYRSKLSYLMAALKLFWITSRHRSYDVVHAHYGLAGVPGLFCWKVPLVVTLHGSDALIGRVQPFISRCVCHLADEVVVVSKKINSVIPGKVIPCGVNLQVFRPIDRNEARVRLGLDKDKKFILFPFDPKRTIKRYDLAKAAVCRLASQGYNVDLLVASSVKNEEMPWYYNAADIMILCSNSEGSPTSVKEALSCNIPVVSADVGDVREIMDGIEGTKICEQNIHSLSNCLEELVNHHNRSSFNGRVAMKRYDQQHTAELIVKVYEEAIRKERRSTNRLLKD